MVRRCEWYTYTTVHPTKRFLYWANRHLRKIPADWREYYRTLLRQETFAYRHVNTNWDQFGAVVEGYRKAQWVLRKYGQEPDLDSIPAPYKDFYAETTQDERVYAYRRSFEIKELQAMQRNDGETNGRTAAYGHIPVNRNEPLQGGTSQRNLSAKDGRGSPQHAHDLPAPRDNEMEVREDDEENSWSNVTSGIQDTEETNPILKLRENKANALKELEGIGFEDE